MQVQKFLIFLLLTFHLVASLRIRRPRHKKAKRQQLVNGTEIADLPSTPPPSVETASEIILESTTQTMLQREIQSLIETLKTTTREREAKTPPPPLPPLEEKITEPRHIDLECKFGNASDYLSIEFPGRYLYTCESFNLRLVDESTHIASVIGEHGVGLSNGDVLALRNVFSRTRFIPNDIAGVFPNLHHLYVPASRIQAIRRRNFAGMSELTTLDLRNNELESLDNDVFLDLFGLEILALSGNLLKKLPSNAFLNLHGLRYFDVSENDIAFFDDEILSTNLELEELLLDHNRIKSVRANFERFRDIGFIDLRGNMCIDTLYLKDHPDYPLLFELQEEINYNCTKRDARDIKIPSGTADLKSIVSWEICSQLRLPTNGKMCLTERKRN